MLIDRADFCRVGAQDVEWYVDGSTSRAKLGTEKLACR